MEQEQGICLKFLLHASDTFKFIPPHLLPKIIPSNPVIISDTVFLLQIHRSRDQDSPLSLWERARVRVILEKLECINSLYFANWSLS